jgi:flagellar hook-associated protein 3 FlgL
VLTLTQADAATTQYADNRTSARNALQLEDSVLSSVTSLLQDVRTTAVSAGNPTVTDADRASLATQISAQLQQLMGYANTTDGNGAYLFSGYQGGQQPFSGAGAQIAYAGDEGQRLIQVGPARRMAVSDPGSALFTRVPTASGNFLATPGAANAGSATLGPATTGTSDGDVYRVTFHPATHTYDQRNLTTGATVNGIAYADGGTLAIGGVQYDLRGTPADGDSYTVPAPAQSVFQTLGNLVTALQTPADDDAGKAQLSQSISVALANLDQSLDRVLTVRADIGVRLQELDSLDDMGDAVGLQYQSNISQLQDVDYAAAISDLTRKQTYLQAAQQSFVRVTGMSLFDFLT